MAPVRLVFLARLRESLGVAAEEVDLPAHVVSVEALRNWLAARGGAWESELAAGRAVRVAVNQNMASGATAVGGGDEIAFFPPVTGG